MHPSISPKNQTTPSRQRTAARCATIREAVDYMTGIGKKRELRSQWQRVGKLILAKEDVRTVSGALELALFMDAKLDVSKVPVE